jgi:methionyl-tRNA formyltransferase
MRIVFFGTPDFAVPSLEALAARHEVVLVVAQPDRPAGRGMKLHKPPVAERAQALGLPVVQPPKIRTEEFHSQIRDTRADVAIVIAYGRILPGPLLAVPRHGFINVHGSLLPKYRGAAPIQRAIEAGETKTGVTIMRVDEELDHGAMLHLEEMEIGPDERLPSVAYRMSRLGAGALIRALDDLELGTLVDVEQDHARATHAPKIEKHEGRITFEEPARQIYNRFRAFDPWPGMFFETGGGTIKALELRPRERSGKPRTILSIDEGITVATGEGSIEMTALQRPGKPRAGAAEVARALGWHVGDRIP